MKPTRRNRSLVLLLAAAGVVLSLAGCDDEAGRSPASATQPAGKTPSPDDHAAYASALGSANDFCLAWRTRDYEAGRAMLTVRLQRKYPEDSLRSAIVGLANPRHEAYEISAGSRLGKGRFAFKLRLFLLYSGERDTRIEAPVERIVLVQDDSGKWRVDEFPMLK